MGEVINTNFIRMDRKEKLLLSKLRNGDYTRNWLHHYRVEIDGVTEVYGIVELHNWFGDQLKIGKQRK